VNPYLILAGVSFFVLSTAGSYIAGRRDGQRIELAGCLATAAAVQEASRIAETAIAKGLAEQEVRTVTIRQQTERIIEKTPDTVTCAAPGMLGTTNAALAGTEPPSDSELSGTGPDAGGDVR
jgi:hypothetical protein